MKARPKLKKKEQLLNVLIAVHHAPSRPPKTLRTPLKNFMCAVQMIFAGAAMYLPANPSASWFQAKPQTDLSTYLCRASRRQSRQRPKRP